MDVTSVADLGRLPRVLLEIKHAGRGQWEECHLGEVQSGRAPARVDPGAGTGSSCRILQGRARGGEILISKTCL